MAAHLSKDSGVAWVVGASSGIGWHLSQALAEAGITVAATARSGDRLEALAASDPQGRIRAYPGDVTEEQGLCELAERVETELGPMTRVFLNAGDYTPMPLMDFDVDLFRRMVEINYMGVVHGLAAVMPGMLARGAGQILVTASVAGYRGLPLAAPYGATKAALINLCESLRPELAQRGVRIRLINPGFVRSPMTDKNPFKMPFIIEPEEAVRRIMRELDGSHFEITFPKRFTYLLKLLRLLPYRLYFPLIERATAK